MNWGDTVQCPTRDLLLHSSNMQLIHGLLPLFLLDHSSPPPILTLMLLVQVPVPCLNHCLWLPFCLPPKSFHNGAVSSASQPIELVTMPKLMNVPLFMALFGSHGQSVNPLHAPCCGHTEQTQHVLPAFIPTGFLYLGFSSTLSLHLVSSCPFFRYLVKSSQKHFSPLRLSCPQALFTPLPLLCHFHTSVTPIRLVVPHEYWTVLVHLYYCNKAPETR
jgi:hypothetical protein